MLGRLASSNFQPARQTIPFPVDETVPSYLSEFSADVMERLKSGYHVLLFGPRGTGKSSLLTALQHQCGARAIPCALAAQTSGLADIVDACSRAYPDTDLCGLQRRAMATRLRLAAERIPGVVLLDHVRELTTAMIGFLRLLRGGVIGALLCVDIDIDFEHERLLRWRRYALCARMPLMPNGALRRLLGELCVAHGVPTLEATALRYLIHAARGRVGWVSECARRLQRSAYWSEGHLHLTTLCTDSELALRQKPGPRLRRSRPSA